MRIIQNNAMFKVYWVFFFSEAKNSNNLAIYFMFWSLFSSAVHNEQTHASLIKLVLRVLIQFETLIGYYSLAQRLLPETMDRFCNTFIHQLQGKLCILTGVLEGLVQDLVSHDQLHSTFGELAEEYSFYLSAMLFENLMKRLNDYVDKQNQRTWNNDNPQHLNIQNKSPLIHISLPRIMTSTSH